MPRILADPGFLRWLRGALFGAFCLNLEVITVRKRSRGKVMFLHLSVILSTGRLSRIRPGGVCPGGGGLSKHRSRGEGWCPGPGPGEGSVHTQTQAQGGGGVSQYALRQTTPPPADGYCYGQHASYWNAFLY